MISDGVSQGNEHINSDLQNVEKMPKAAARRQEEIERNKKEDRSQTFSENPVVESIVDEMNIKFAVLEQPTFLILEEGSDGSFSLDKKQSFKDRFQNKPIDVEGKKKSKAEIFLESPRRRTFRKIVINPRVIGHYERDEIWFYNLWKGLAIIPQQGISEKIKKHILEVICSGNWEHYEYLMHLLANWVQKPEERTVAILLRGPQGCGKNIFVDAIGRFFGTAYAVYDDVERLLGKFNSELATKILIFADEALWGGRKSDSGKLKAAITSETLWIEPKGKDKIEIPNYRKFIAASNERFALPLDPDDRRWLVLDCSGHKVGDKQHFDEIAEELNNGGCAALLYDLKNINLEEFNPRKLPANDNSFDLKLQCSSSFLQYIHAVLNEERLDLSSSNGFAWTEEGVSIRTDVLRDNYKVFCSREKLPLQGEKECGWVLKTLFKNTNFKRGRKRFGGERHPIYIFPPLSKSRERLADHFHVSNAEKIFPEDEEIE